VGLKYSGIAFTWVKTLRSRADMLFITKQDFHVGLGYTTRKNTELCLLARKGSPKRVSRSVRELIIAPVREHSRKPDEVYDRIEAYIPGPYLELFARRTRHNWTAWGNQTNKFDKANDAA
jgi:N6-adenosine-specific RNA methylase IME4